jgi:hypothetical protein
VEQLPEVPAQHGVEADHRLVENEQLRPVEQRRGEGGAGALASREAVDALPGLRSQVDLVENLLDPVG